MRKSCLLLACEKKNRKERSVNTRKTAFYDRNKAECRDFSFTIRKYTALLANYCIYSDYDYIFSMIILILQYYEMSYGLNVEMHKQVSFLHISLLPLFKASSGSSYVSVYAAALTYDE